MASFAGAYRMTKDKPQTGSSFERWPETLMRTAKAVGRELRLELV
jgi:hypothetical protein